VHTFVAIGFASNSVAVSGRIFPSVDQHVGIFGGYFPREADKISMRHIGVVVKDAHRALSVIGLSVFELVGEYTLTLDEFEISSSSGFTQHLRHHCRPSVSSSQVWDVACDSWHWTNKYDIREHCMTRTAQDYLSSSSTLMKPGVSDRFSSRALIFVTVSSSN